MAKKITVTICVAFISSFPLIKLQAHFISAPALIRWLKETNLAVAGLPLIFNPIESLAGIGHYHQGRVKSKSSRNHNFAMSVTPPLIHPSPAFFCCLAQAF
jgi:hypothetical protein